MKRKSILRTTMFLTGGAVVLCGCASDRPREERPPKPGFFSQYDRMAIHQFADVQARNGAVADAMLQPAHFDGTELNSLGRRKLNLMTAGREQRDTTIYMNFAEDDLMGPRRESVLAFLADAEIPEARVQLVSGPNPHLTSPAAGHLERIERTESTGGGEWTSDPGTFSGPME